MSAIRRSSATAALALFAALAMISTALAQGPTAGSATDPASAAKKKGCKGKKGKKKSAAAAKKCKKKKKKQQPPPTPPGPTSAVRATITWNTAADMDLVVYAPEGTESRVGQSPNAISSSSFSVDDSDGLGPETFTDLALSSARQFTYLICMDDDRGAVDTVVTLKYQRADGSTSTTESPIGAFISSGDAALIQPAGGPTPPASPDPCT